MAFFQRWWNQQKEDRRTAVRELVAQGQLEFINGGWCMNDEGSTHYIDIIDQMSLGLEYNNDIYINSFITKTVKSNYDFF